MPDCMASVFQPMARGRISRGTSMGPSAALVGMVNARPTPNTADNAKMATRLGLLVVASSASPLEQATCSAQQPSRILRRSTVGRLAGEQHQREHWQELREPDHADEE